MVARAPHAAVAALVLGAASLIPGPAADAGGRTAPARYSAVRSVPGEVLVRYRRGVDRRERAAIRREARVRLEERLPLPRLELVRVVGGRGVAKSVAELEDLAGVAYAEPNFRYRIDATMPDDPMFGDQWALDKIDAPEVWDTATGIPEVVVAVLDTGLEHLHPDLDENRWMNTGEIPLNVNDDDNNDFVDDDAGWDFVGDDNDPRDANGHGSHVAGILGAEGNNTTGVAGVNWDVSIMPLRVCDAGGFCDSASIIEGIDYAGDMGAHVANMSFSGGAFSLAQKTAIDAAGDTLFVTSAGNSGSNNDATPQYPCNYTSANLICVAASTETDSRWPSSNFGATSVDLAAPGDDVLSTYVHFDTPYPFDDSLEGAPMWDFVEEATPEPLKWERTTEASQSATHSLADSFDDDYATSDDVAVTTTSPVDLGGRSGCSLQYWLKLETEAGDDWLRVEAAHGATPTDFELIDRWSGTSDEIFLSFTSDLGEFDGDTQTGLRFRLEADDDTIVGDGAHVDDVTLRCPAESYGPSDGYALIEGTSMAAPHVAGAGALLRSEEPGATVSELKAAILGSVDPAPAFAGITVTGGRLNLNRALAFLTDVSPPGAPVPVAPGDGTTVTTASPTFAWEASADPESGVAKYQLFVDGSLNREVSGGSTSATPVAALSEGPHTWFVRVVNGVGLTADSPTRSFTTDPAESHGRSVSLKLRKHLIARGSLAEADGFAGCVQGATVRLQRKRRGAWRTIETVTPKSTGAFRAKIKDRPGRYRASVSETTVGNDVCGAAVSRSVRHRH
jgi:subtilisin family serine protease